MKASLAWASGDRPFDEPEIANRVAARHTCSPNFLIQEYNVNDLHSEIFLEPIKFENGHITPPTGPGLGVELDEKVVARQLCKD